MYYNLIFIALTLLISSVRAHSGSSLGFIENKGQIAEHKTLRKRPDIFYKLEGGGVNAYFKQDGSIEYHFFKKRAEKKLPVKPNLTPSSTVDSFGIYYSRVDFKFINTLPSTPIPVGSPKQMVRNYYLEGCPDGILGVQEYDAIVYKNIYHHIDLKYYIVNNQLKYELIVHKGARLNDIKLTYDGAKSVKTLHGKLIVHTELKDVEEQAPYCYNAQTQKEIGSSFVYDDHHHTITFRLKDMSSDRPCSQDIVIDPTIAWSTYFDDGDYMGQPIVDANNNFYGNTTTTRNTFPVLSSGVLGQYFSTSISGVADLGIFKFNANYQLQWATFYGGNGNEYAVQDQNLAFDEVNQKLFIVGYISGGSFSTFPTFNPGGSAFFQSTIRNGWYLPFFLKFNSNGVREWATVFDHEASSTAPANLNMKSIYFKNGKLYFCGSQQTTLGPNTIPLRNTIPGAYYQAGPNLVVAPFIGRFDGSTLALEWSTYVNAGINSPVTAMFLSDLIVDDNNAIFALGTVYEGSDVNALTLNNSGSGTYYKGTLGKTDGYIIKFNAALTVTWASLIGGARDDTFEALNIDRNGAIFCVGYTTSDDFPIKDPLGGAYVKATRSTTTSSSYDATITKFSNTGALLWSTYYGGANGTAGDTENIFLDVDIARTGDVFVSGYTSCSDFPTLIASGTFNDNALAGNKDNCYVKFDNNGVRKWATYYGGSGSDKHLYAFSGISPNCDHFFVSFPYLGSNDVMMVTPPGSYSNLNFSVRNVDISGVCPSMLGFTDNQSVTSIPPTSISASPPNVCVGISSTLSISDGTLGTGASWQWYSGSCGGTPVGSGSLIVVSPTMTTVYYLRAESPCGTTSCVSTTLTVSPAGSTAGTATASPMAICVGMTSTLTVNGGSLGAKADWQWYTDGCGTTPIGSGSVVVVSPTVTTVYFVRAEGPCGITACSSTTVILLPGGSILGTAVTSPITTNCGGRIFDLTINGGSLTPGNSSVWAWYTGSCGGTAAGAGSIIAVSPTATTVYYVRAEGPCGITSCVTTTITVSPGGSVLGTAVASPSTLCTNGSSTLSVSGGTLGLGATWQWYSGSCGVVPVGTGSTIVVSPTTTTAYFVRADGPCGITACSSTTVTLMPGGSVLGTVVASPSNICSGSSSTLSVIGGLLGTGSTWEWYIGGCGVTAVGTGSMIVVSPTATTVYYLRAEGTCGNTACVSSTVIVTPGSSVLGTAVASPSNICIGNSTTLTVVGGSLASGDTWEWHTGSCSGPSVGSGSTIVVSPTATTVYFLRAEGSCGVTSCVSTIVSVSPGGSVLGTAIASPSAICVGKSSTLTVVGGSLASGAAWNWYSGNCGGTAVGTGTMVVVSPTVTTVYFVRAEGGCGSSTCTTITVTVASSPTVALNSGNICVGESFTLAPSGASSYTYSSGTAIVSPTATSTYTVTGSSGGCSGIASSTVSVFSVPVITGSVIKQASCFASKDASISLIASGADQFNWSPNVSSTSIATNLGPGIYNCTLSSGSVCQVITSFTITQPSALNGQVSSTNTACGACNGSASLVASGGTAPYAYWWSEGTGNKSNNTNLCSGTVSYSVTDAKGCVMSGTANIGASSAFEATVSTSSNLIFPNETISITATNGQSHHWSPATFLNCTSCNPVTATPNENITYCVEVTNTDGCRDTACISITLKCGDLFIPTAFSPNQDGQNDGFKAYGNCIDDILLNIFDRWGELIFETTDPTDKWDGTYKGKPLSPGVFIYHLAAKLNTGETIIKKGNVSLLK